MSDARQVYAGYHERPELCRCPGCMAHLKSVERVGGLGGCAMRSMSEDELRVAREKLREHQAEALRDSVRVDAAKLQALRGEIEAMDGYRGGRDVLDAPYLRLVRSVLDRARELVR